MSMSKPTFEKVVMQAFGYEDTQRRPVVDEVPISVILAAHQSDIEEAELRIIQELVIHSQVNREKWVYPTQTLLEYQNEFLARLTSSKNVPGIELLELSNELSLRSRNSEFDLDEVALCKGCGAMKHLNESGYCGRCVDKINSSVVD